MTLEHVSQAIVIDHRDCGAYKYFLKPEGYSDPDEEREAHRHQADKLEAPIYRIKPGLQVTKWLASLNPAGAGTLERGGMIEDFTDLELERI